MRRLPPLLLVASLLGACRAATSAPPPRPLPAPPPLAAPSPPSTASLIAALDRETTTRADPSNGLVSDCTVRTAWARFQTLSGDARAPLARSLFAWLLTRAWSLYDGGPMIVAAADQLGDAAIDATVDACDRPAPPPGHTTVLLHLRGRDELLARLLARTRAVVAAVTEPVDEATLRRASSLFRALVTLERPVPVHTLLLEVAADASRPSALRRAAIAHVNRGDLPQVVTGLLELARAPGDLAVRAAALRAVTGAPNATLLHRLDAVYESSPPGHDGAPLRALVGEVHLRARGLDALPTITVWLTREGPRRVGRIEVDAWAHRLALPLAREGARWRRLLAHRHPRVRALGVLTWSWFGHQGDVAALEALRSDSALLSGASWVEGAATVGELAAWALAHHQRIDPQELGCCH